MNKHLRLAYLLVIALLTVSSMAIAQQVVISELYGGGGNSGATLRNDFIELYNPTNSTINLAGWSVQYASATGTTWQVTNLTGSIAAKGFYLVQQAQGTGGTASLPTPDAIGTIAMSGTAGKVALCNTTTALSGSNPTGTAIIDLVGFGATANGFEGAASAAPSNTTSIERKANATSNATSMGVGGIDELLGNGQDSNNNLNDFIVRSSPQPQNTSSSVEPVLTDITPPTFTSTFPKTSNLSSSGFNLLTSLNEVGKTYFVVLPNNAPAPSSSQVINRQDGGTPPGSAISFGTIDVANADTDYSASVTGLASATDYDVYVVAEDLVPNLQTAPVKLDVLTNTAGDVTPPTFTATYPNVSSVSATSFTVRTNLDEQGKTYFVVLPAGATAPTSAQVRDGQGNFAGTINVTSAGTEFISQVSGLSPSTGYDVYVVAEDNVPNLQSNPTKISATTGAQYLEDFNVCDGTASFTQYSVTGAQVWGCTDFGRNSTKGIRMNGFAAGSAVDNQDWLISPITTLSPNASLSFYSQFSFVGPSLQLKISTNYTGSGDPTTATWTDLNGNFPTVASTSLSDWTLSNVDLSAYASESVYVAFVYTSTTSTNAAARWTLDEITIGNGTPRYLQTTPSALLFTSGNSVKQYTLKGFNLTNSVTITAPTNFQVSKDNTTFSSSLSFTASEAAAQPTVYVRFTPASPNTNTFTGSIAHTSSGVSPKNVNVIGTDKSLTFDVVTWNIEWFSVTSDQSGVGVGPGAGSGPRTPAQVALQRANVASVIKIIDADLYAFQEVGNENANFDGLVADLGAGWAGIRSLTPLVPSPSYGTDPDKVQRLAIIYKTSVVNPVSTRSVLASVNTASLVGYPSTNDRFWASGRFPFLMTANVTLGGTTKQIDFVDIHARANGGSTTTDQKNRYDMRRYDVEYLKDSLDARFASRNLILLGDFNDDVKATVVAAAGTTESSYKKYVDDNLNYQVLTLPLSQANAVTFVGSSFSMLDQIIISNELNGDYLASSTSIEDARNYITNYVNTTSDHLPVTARFVITKSNQSIAFGALPSKTFGDVAFSVSATATSGLPVTFSSSDPTIASISGNTVTILKAGTVTITASQAGDGSYNGAADVIQALTINKANQTITFNALAAKTFGDAAFILSASSTSGLPITYTSSDATIASISGNTVTILKAGTVNITAIQTGDNSYNAAPSEVQPLVINKANQQIIFAAISEKQFGDAPFALNANTTSGLPITFTALTSNKVTIANNQATIVAGGRVIIVASQPGNANYNAAASVSQTFCIKPAKPTISVSLASGNATLTSSASGGFKWFLNGALIPNANGQSYIATLAGTYKVQVTLDDCLSDFSNDVPVIITGDLPTGNAYISLYPNPTAGSLFISGLEPETNECSIVDLLGRPILMNLEKSGDLHRLTTESLVDGVYMLRVNQSNSVLQLKFVKKN